MKKEDWILLLVIASLLGSAFVMKKFSPLLKQEENTKTEETQQDNPEWLNDVAETQRKATEHRY